MLIIVGGPSGCGKSTVAHALSEKLGCASVEGDTVHPQHNIDKMSAGVPLTDEDRWGWLAEVVRQGTEAAGDGNAVVACSALAKRYRSYMQELTVQAVVYVFLNLSRDELLRRTANRQGHFMKSDMVDSQLRTLEVPTPNEKALVINVPLSTEEIVDLVVSAFDDDLRYRAATAT